MFWFEVLVLLLDNKMTTQTVIECIKRLVDDTEADIPMK